jgi:hypothetical protein
VKSPTTGLKYVRWQTAAYDTGCTAHAVLWCCCSAGASPVACWGPLLLRTPAPAPESTMAYGRQSLPLHSRPTGTIYVAADPDPRCTSRFGLLQVTEFIETYTDVLLEHASVLPGNTAAAHTVLARLPAALAVNKCHPLAVLSDCNQGVLFQETRPAAADSHGHHHRCPACNLPR